MATPTPPPPSSTSPTGPQPFLFPPEYSFPPFFTLQTNLTTQHAQLTKWASLVLSYCRHHRIFKLSLSGTGTTTSSPSITSPTPTTEVDTTALFHNARLNRRLALSDIRAVINFLRKDGRAEYITSGGSSSSGAEDGAGGDLVWIYWRTPEEWAALVEGWVDGTGQKGSVLTVYELVEGDGTRGTGEFVFPFAPS